MQKPRRPARRGQAILDFERINKRYDDDVATLMTGIDSGDSDGIENAAFESDNSVLSANKDLFNAYIVGFQNVFSTFFDKHHDDALMTLSALLDSLRFDLAFMMKVSIAITALSRIILQL